MEVLEMSVLNCKRVFSTINTRTNSILTYHLKGKGR